MADDNNGEKRGGLEKQGGRESIVQPEHNFEHINAPDDVDRFAQFVCQILISREDGTGVDVRGTGILVGPKHVLTNFHVVENINPSAIKCRFDVRRRVLGGIAEGPLAAVTAKPADSPYSDLENTGKYTVDSEEHPEADELDYALLELSENIGHKRFEIQHGVSVERRWLSLPKQKPTVDPRSGVYILQHPQGGALKSATGPIAPLQPNNGTRLRYKTNTDKGSSGSPCFRTTSGDNKELVLVAVHNYGDPSWHGKDSEFNHGIPIELIAQDLRKKGIEPPSDRYLPHIKKIIGIFLVLAAAAILAWSFRCSIGLVQCVDLNGTTQTDPNEEPWHVNELACALPTPAPSYSSLSGDWCGRWWDSENNKWIKGMASVQVDGNELTIHHDTGYKYTIKVKRTSDGRLRGKLVETNDPQSIVDAGWHGRVRSFKRIDGTSSGGLRWDFRR